MASGEGPENGSSSSVGEAAVRVGWAGALALALAPFAIFAALAVLDSFIR